MTTPPPADLLPDDLTLHDQGVDALDCQYSIFRGDECILLFNPVPPLTAQDVLLALRPQPIAGGWEEAIEAAAKIAEEGCFDIGCTAIEAEGVVRRTRDAIAISIRALRRPAQMQPSGAGVMRLAKAWVKAASDNDWHGSRQTKDALAAAKAAFTAVIDRPARSVTMPSEPTEEIINAIVDAGEAYHGNTLNGPDGYGAHVYRAIRAALAAMRGDHG